nr:GIY-YIG nuclease family protein [uncultured Devosia sp.]
MWYVYFLELSNGDIYVGSTNNLKRRLSSHQTGDVLCQRGHIGPSGSSPTSQSKLSGMRESWRSISSPAQEKQLLLNA